ncbi:CHAD domain-containing protein [Roseomonas alkaliterrae]|uniref:CHAD domain-containing protein n=2 Tax=Neoroseomonas alkaliterrae TaxID=1452450 RepID=A0A840YC52_9PROT|nr:CHAD domain-containing protein [Neoroseomonas alkaliterrae]MBB5691533.1 CHAD domain-containing protein [Neoroseomonas alkaliterrae]
MPAGHAGSARARTAEADGEPRAEAAEAEARAAEPEAALSLEFVLPPEAAARFGRQAAVSRWRVGRARSLPGDRIWFDTPEGTLAAQGLIVEAPARGPRRLLRIRPEAAGPWHPGQPASVLRELAADAVPEEAEGGGLAAIAAFAGREHAYRLAPPEGAVEARLLTGEIRSVAAQRPAARLTLSGAPAAVLAVARALAADLPMLPPTANLAEEGRALAAGAPARPFRQGAPDTSAATTAEEAFRHAIGHLLEVVRQCTARIAPEATPEPVHQARVALRRLRSVFRVFRRATDCAALRALDGRLREVLAVLGPARDWDVFLGGIAADVAAAFPGDRRIEALLRAAAKEREAAYAAVERMLEGAAWRMLLLDALEVLLLRPWREGAEEARREVLDAPATDFGREILDRRWTRLRRAGEDFASLTAEELHELRLDGKRLRYAAELFAPLFGPKAGRRFLRRLAALQDGLGLANDAAVARGLVARLARQGDAGRAWAVGVVEGWSVARVAADRGAAREAWDRLLRRDRFWSSD